MTLLLNYTKHHYKCILLVRYNTVFQLNFTGPKRTPSNKNENTNFLRLEGNQWPFFQLRCARRGIATNTFTCACKSWVLSYSYKSYRVRVGPPARSLDRMNPSMTYSYLNIYNLARICIWGSGLDVKLCRRVPKSSGRGLFPFLSFRSHKCL